MEGRGVVAGVEGEGSYQKQSHTAHQTKGKGTCLGQ